MWQEERQDVGQNSPRGDEVTRNGLDQSRTRTRYTIVVNTVQFRPAMHTHDDKVQSRVERRSLWSEPMKQGGATNNAHWERLCEEGFETARTQRAPPTASVTV